MKRHATALIDESRCIGCTLCIEACPVDAIIGAQRYMHTVVESWCIGCGLCLPPCPVDCIAMVPLPPEKRNWRTQDAQGARRRVRLRKAQRARATAPAAPTTPQQRRAVLSAAIAQSRAKRPVTRK